MKMKYVLCCLLLLGTLMPLTAQKKRAKKVKAKKEVMKVLTSTYMNKSRGIGPIGEVYEFKVKTNVSNLIIDSVWFGATPVPCDLFATYGGFTTKQTEKPGIYYIKANKNVYTSFPQYHDSTEAFKNFKANVPFKGVAMIIWKQGGKRGFVPVDTAYQQLNTTRPQ